MNYWSESSCLESHDFLILSVFTWSWIYRRFYILTQRSVKNESKSKHPAYFRMPSFFCSKAELFICWSECIDDRGNISSLTCMQVWFDWKCFYCILILVWYCVVMLIRVMNSCLDIWELKVVVLFHRKFDSVHYVAICLFCVGTRLGVHRLLDEVNLKLLFSFAVKEWPMKLSWNAAWLLVVSCSLSLTDNKYMVFFQFSACL